MDTTTTTTQTSDAVVVTLERIVPKKGDDIACIDIALMKSVDVHLDAPLGDRAVKDGSFEGRVVQKADAPYDNVDY